MPDTVEILHVASITDQTNGNLRVETHHLQLELRKRDPESVDMRIVRRAVAESQWVALTFDPATKMIHSAYWPVTETVVDLAQSTQKPGLTVTLQMRPTRVHLSSGHPDFETLAKRLQNAQSTRKLACIAVNPATSEIEAVQVTNE